MASRERWWKVTVIPKEPLDLSAPGDKQVTEVVWIGLTVQRSWAIYQANQILVTRGFTPGIVKKVEVCVGEQKKDGVYEEVPGFPRPA